MCVCEAGLHYRHLIVIRKSSVVISSDTVAFVKVSVDTGVDGRIILRWIFGKWNVGIWIGSSLLWIGTCGGNLCECGNEPSGSIKYGEFLDYLRTS